MFICLLSLTTEVALFWDRVLLTHRREVFCVGLFIFCFFYSVWLTDVQRLPEKQHQPLKLKCSQSWGVDLTGFAVTHPLTCALDTWLAKWCMFVCVLVFIWLYVPGQKIKRSCKRYWTNYCLHKWTRIFSHPPPCNSIQGQSGPGAYPSTPGRAAPRTGCQTMAWHIHAHTDMLLAM